MVFKLFWAVVFGTLFILIYIAVGCGSLLVLPAGWYSYVASPVSHIGPLAGTWCVGLAVGDSAAVGITVQAPVGSPASTLPLTHLMPATMTP